MYDIIKTVYASKYSRTKVAQGCAVAWRKFLTIDIPLKNYFIEAPLRLKVTVIASCIVPSLLYGAQTFDPL